MIGSFNAANLECSIKKIKLIESVNYRCYIHVKISAKLHVVQTKL